MEEYLKRIADALERAFPLDPNTAFFENADAFIWEPDRNHFTEVSSISTIDISLLKGMDKEIDQLTRNTKAFAVGNIANNVLVWGARGMGKSTLIKSVVKATSAKNNSLKIHEPLNQVSSKIKERVIEKKITLIISEIKKYFHSMPKIAVLGFNPHAGEDGQIGNEEILEILPAILKFQRNNNCVVDGPFPADGFFGSKEYKNYDVTLAMYHDQALIPLKLLAFSDAINVTLGLPFIRTSPGHGTGIEIAKDFIADCNSFYQAILFAGTMSNLISQNVPPYFNA